MEPALEFAQVRSSEAERDRQLRLGQTIFQPSTLDLGPEPDQIGLSLSELEEGHTTANGSLRIDRSNAGVIHRRGRKGAKPGLHLPKQTAQESPPLSLPETRKHLDLDIGVGIGKFNDGHAELGRTAKADTRHKIRSATTVHNHRTKGLGIGHETQGKTTGSNRDALSIVDTSIDVPIDAPKRADPQMSDFKIRHRR